MTYLALLAGLVLLVLGAEGFVRGASDIARRLGVSPLLIGLTLVGFGTSLPELVISIQAALDNAPGLVMGNIVGTNTANILLILGLGAALSPIPVHRGILRRDGSILMLSSLAALAVVLIGQLERIAGTIFLVLLVLYVVYAYRSDRRATASADLRLAAAPRTLPKTKLWRDLLFAFGGLALILLGARLLVTAAIDLARDFGVTETLIGLTIVAVGTSSPEIVITIVSAVKKKADLALGNIIGSNIFNIFGILGITGLVRPIAMPPEMLAGDIWVMLAATVLMLVCAHTSRIIHRWEGILFLFAYAAYLAWLIAGATGNLPF